jgi:hypothetical protein
MSIALAIVALVVLLVLIVVGMKMRRETRAAERQEAGDRANVGDRQHTDSLRRRAEVRAAPARPADTNASPPEE